MRALLICPDADVRGAFQKTADRYSVMRVTKAMDHYPDEEGMRRLIRMWAPDVIFLSMEDAYGAGQVSRQINSEFPTIQRIGLSKAEEPAVFRLALQLRMAELLVPPFDDDRFLEMLKRLSEHLTLHPAKTGNSGQIFAFMPAKGGVGSSTLAANTAWGFADLPDSHVLLADFDVSSGMTGFMFNAEHDFSLRDAAARKKELDEETWQRLVKKVGNIDLLLSGAPAIDDGIAPEDVQPVLDFARRSYSVVGADISDTIDERSLAVLREANKIFLVTTPELASLRMAKLKVMALRKLEFEDKTRLLLNRVTRKMDLKLDEIQTTVGLPVFATFPCEYADVSAAARKAQASPRLASSIKAFVAKINERTAPEKKKKARFIERFAMVPARYGFR
jgi:pilus assembly protein CpaE